jgi:hypothetical protein
MTSIPNRTNCSITTHCRRYSLNNNNKIIFDVNLDEWGTSGRTRPTIRDLWGLCAELDLRRACDYIAADILGRAGPDISPTGEKPRVSMPFL